MMSSFQIFGTSPEGKSMLGQKGIFKRLGCGFLNQFKRNVVNGSQAGYTKQTDGRGEAKLAILRPKN